MEIADYLKVARRSLWVLLVVPLGAALLAAAAVATSPPSYQATATVDLPLGDEKSPYSGNHGQVLYVDDFRNAATSDPVITTAAEQTGVDEKKLTNGLLVKQVGDSSVMTITFASTNKAVPTAVVQATAAATLDRILQPQYDTARAALDQAYAARKPLLQEQADLAKQTGGVSPDNAIRAVQQQIASLERQRHNLIARGISPSTLAAVEQQLKEERAKLVAYAPLALKYQKLKTELNAANQLVTKESQVVQAITVMQQAATSPSAITVTPAKRKAKLPTLISSSVAAAAAGAFLALGIIAVMELLARRRRRDRVEPTDLATSPHGEPSTSAAVVSGSPDAAAEDEVPDRGTARRRRWRRSPPAGASARLAADDAAAPAPPPPSAPRTVGPARPSLKQK